MVVAWLALIDDLHQELHRESVSLMVLLDLSVVFSIIDHGVLLNWLTQLELGGTILQWLHFFWQTQMMRLQDTFSKSCLLTCGVPQ